MIDGLYCGVEDCYKVLGLSREATRNEISKAYRQLARKYHPDVHKTEEDKLKTVELFRAVANAYEILKDEESRADYDYMLDHPDEVYSHYYRYYRRRMTPRVDVRIVILVSIIVISVIQYFVAWQRYDTAISFLLTVPKYRNRAVECAKMEGLVLDKRTRGKSKAETKEETEAVIRRILENNMDIRGGYAKPKITDIFLIQLILLPYTVCTYLSWYFLWIWKYDIQKQPYGIEEKLYLIRKNMKMGNTQFEQYEEDEKNNFLRDELWIPEKFKKWKQKKDEDMKKQMAENGRVKAYRRYIKTHGPSRITFDDS